MGSDIISLLKDNKPALIFLVRFVALYFILNTLYGVFITLYAPAADPITIEVTNQTVWFLNLIHEQVTSVVVPDSQSVYVLWKDKNVISVFEGCNSVNVLVVFLSFVFSFSNQWKQAFLFIAWGSLVLYFINLIRVIALFEVAVFFPDSMYFFHKFLFTGMIYMVVFLLWFLWIKKQKKVES